MKLTGYSDGSLSAVRVEAVKKYLLANTTVQEREAIWITHSFKVKNVTCLNLYNFYKFKHFKK